VTEPLLLTSFLDRAGEFFGDKRIAGYHDGQRVHAYTYRDYQARTEPPLTGPPVRSEDDLAALCDTSGTTGRPKGVGYSHRALYLHTFAAAWPTATRSANVTPCCTWYPCSTPTPGASRSPR
jgi:long-subunit acyl-CoA synthetase (AMP-forming)